MLIQKTIFFWFFFFSLFELFLTLVCGNNIGSLVNNLFWVKIFNPFPSLTAFGYGKYGILQYVSSSLYSGGKSSNSSLSPNFSL